MIKGGVQCWKREKGECVVWTVVIFIIFVLPSNLIVLDKERGRFRVKSVKVIMCYKLKTVVEL